MKVTLNIKSGDVVRSVSLSGESVTLGRGDESGIVLAGDKGLSRRHVTLHAHDGRVRIVDEGSTNGSFVNGERVAAGGRDLSDGDEIRMGNSTNITVNIKRETAARETIHAAPSPAPLPLNVRIAAIAVTMIILSGLGFVLYSTTRRQEPQAAGEAETASASPSPDANYVKVGGDPAPSSPTATAAQTPATPAPSPTASPAAPAETPAPAPDASLPLSQHGADTTAARRRLYKEMSEEEKTRFIQERAQHVAMMMGHRPYAFTPDALKVIKYWLDAFASRVGNRRTGLWGGDTISILERGRNHAPVIIRAFNENNVPIVIGLYIPFIETEYTNIASSNYAGAAGLFQFLAPTAKHYGVEPEERTNVPKMASAAARYFRDNIVSFGDDPMGVALSIAGYNRAPESVKRDLRNILNIPNNADKERSFWTLIANKSRLDAPFQTQNIDYVPRFFGAAILGETPWAFGIQMHPLSTYTGVAAPESPPSPSPKQ